CLAGLSRLLERSCGFLRRLWSLDWGLSRFGGRQRGGGGRRRGGGGRQRRSSGRQRRCNRNRRILFRFRLAKKLPREAQQNARDESHADYDEERDLLQRERAPLQRENAPRFGEDASCFDRAFQGIFKSMGRSWHSQAFRSTETFSIGTEQDRPLWPTVDASTYKAALSNRAFNCGAAKSRKARSFSGNRR